MIHAVIVVCVLGIGYALVDNMKSRQDEVEASIRAHSKAVLDGG